MVSSHMANCRFPSVTVAIKHNRSGPYWRERDRPKIVKVVNLLHPALMSQPPIGIGLVGTGYAAKVRAEAVNAEPRANLVGITGNTPDKVEAFAVTHATTVFPTWQALINCDAVDLVIIANLNSQHAEIARAALFTGKHVVVEYPLALEVSTAESLIALAQNKGCLLHVEHIELLGGVHQALIAALPEVGTPFYARYATVTPQHPAPTRWTFNHEMFGFPLVGALSRLHRFTHLFGKVAQVTYSSCMCLAQVQFENGVLLDVVYGKGESVWLPERRLEVQGDRGALVFNGDQGLLINAQGEQPLETTGRRGLFARDTAAVLDFLIDGTPLYVDIQASLYTLKVAEAARKSAETSQTVVIR
jgi:biliverdin reductase